MTVMFEGFKEELNESLDERFAKQKSDFFDRIDPILKEVTASREEREIVSDNLSHHEDRIHTIEAHLHLSTD
jgi:hypothetical protein